MDINIDTIKELIGSLGASSFDTLRLETDAFKLTIERRAGAPVQAPAAYAVAAAEASKSDEPKEENLLGTVVKSPIVGTYYTAASPDKPPFVEVGQQVKTGDTIYIVESMKLMNEITSECDGKVAEIYVNNGQAVEYGQPIMRIE